MNYIIYILLFINLFIFIILLSTLKIGKKYFDDNKNVFYYLNNIFFNKISYLDIKYNIYFKLVYQNEFIIEKNNYYVLTDKGINYLHTNNFIDNYRLRILSIVTALFSFSNLILQSLMLLSK